eukprot:296400_1
MQEGQHSIKHNYCQNCKSDQNHNPITNECIQCNHTIDKCETVQIEGKSPLRKSPPPSPMSEGYIETQNNNLRKSPLRVSIQQHINNQEIIADYNESSSDEYDDDKDKQQLLNGIDIHIMDNNSFINSSNNNISPSPISPINNKRKRKRKRKHKKHKHIKKNKYRDRKRRKMNHIKKENENVINLISDDETEISVSNISNISSSYKDYAKNKVNEYNRQNPIFISDDDDDDDIIPVNNYRTRASPPRLSSDNSDIKFDRRFTIKRYGILKSLQLIPNIKCKKDAKKLIDTIRKGMHHIIGEYINYNDRLIAMCIAILEIMELKEGNIRNGYGTFERPQVLVIAPRRHMALEARDVFMKISSFYELYATALIGGISTYKCINKLKNGMQIITGCPGKLSDLIRRKHINKNYFSRLIAVAIDGANDITSSRDMMRDMDTIKAVCPSSMRVLYCDKIMLPHASQDAEQFIRSVDNKIVNCRAERERINKVKNRCSFGEMIQQFSHIVYSCNGGSYWKYKALEDVLNCYYKQFKNMYKVLIFFNRRSELEKVYDGFFTDEKYSSLRLGMIHGKCSNEKREDIICSWKENGGILFTTDLMNSGVSESMDIIVNYEIPFINGVSVYAKRCLVSINRKCMVFSIVSEQDKHNFELIQSHLQMKTEEYGLFNDRGRSRRRYYTDRH